MYEAGRLARLTLTGIRKISTFLIQTKMSISRLSAGGRNGEGAKGEWQETVTIDPHDGKRSEGIQENAGRGEAKAVRVSTRFEEAWGRGEGEENLRYMPVCVFESWAHCCFWSTCAQGTVA